MFKIPKDVVDAESGPRDDVFPEGTWEGTLEVFRTREIHQGEGGDFFLQDKSKNYYAQSCEAGSLQIGSITAVLEGQPNIGEMKYFEDNIFMMIEDVSWDNYEHEEGSDFWRLSQTQLRLTKLAQALGLVDEDEEGVSPTENFDQLLRETEEDNHQNSLYGMRVRFKVVHRKFKKRDGTPGKEAQTVQFYPVG